MPVRRRGEPGGKRHKRRVAAVEEQLRLGLAGVSFENGGRRPHEVRLDGLLGGYIIAPAGNRLIPPSEQIRIAKAESLALSAQEARYEANIQHVLAKSKREASTQRRKDADAAWEGAAADEAGNPSSSSRTSATNPDQARSRSIRDQVRQRCLVDQTQDTGASSSSVRTPPPRRRREKDKGPRYDWDRTAFFYPQAKAAPHGQLSLQDAAPKPPPGSPGARSSESLDSSGAGSPAGPSGSACAPSADEGLAYEPRIHRALVATPEDAPTSPEDPWGGRHYPLPF